MRKIVVFSGAPRIRRYVRCEAVMAAAGVLMGRDKAELQQRIGSMFDRVPPAEVHRP